METQSENVEWGLVDSWAGHMPGLWAGPDPWSEQASVGDNQSIDDSLSLISLSLFNPLRKKIKKVEWQYQHLEVRVNWSSPILIQMFVRTKLLCKNNFFLKVIVKKNSVINSQGSRHHFQQEPILFHFYPILFLFLLILSFYL